MVLSIDPSRMIPVLLLGRLQTTSVCPLTPTPKKGIEPVLQATGMPVRRPRAGICETAVVWEFKPVEVEFNAARSTPTSLAAPESPTTAGQAVGPNPRSPFAGGSGDGGCSRQDMGGSPDALLIFIRNVFPVEASVGGEPTARVTDSCRVARVP